MLLGPMMLRSMLLAPRLWHAIIAGQLAPPIYSVSTNIAAAIICSATSVWICMLLVTPSVLLVLDSMPTNRVCVPIVQLCMILLIPEII